MGQADYIDRKVLVPKTRSCNYFLNSESSFIVQAPCGTGTVFTKNKQKTKTNKKINDIVVERN